MAHKTIRLPPVSQMKCHGMSNGKPCGSTALVKAHVIPKGFARRMRDGNFNVRLTPRGVTKPPNQLGTFDQRILCSPCDNLLGHYDDYAIDLCDRFNKDAVEKNGLFALPDVDGDKFAIFILSVLWRASISTHPDFSRVNLGPFEITAREVLFGSRLLTDMPAFEVMVQRYRAPTIDFSRMYSVPEPTRLDDKNGYGFMLGGFRIHAKLDSRRFPAEWSPHIVNGCRVLRGFLIDMETTSEYKKIRELARRMPGGF